MEYKKCKDFFIIKTNYRGVGDINSIKGRKSFIENVNKHTKFIWSIITQLTNKSEEFWYFNYMMEPLECALEELADNGLLFTNKGEGYSNLFISRDRQDIYDLIINELKKNDIKYKILKKTNLNYFLFYDQPNFLKQKRTWSREFTIKQPMYKKYLRKKKIEKLLKCV